MTEQRTIKPLFAGQEAQHIGQLYYYFSYLLLDYPHVERIIELGTAMGAMSSYLGLWGARKGIPVHTFDQDDFVFKKEHNVDDVCAGAIFKKLDIAMHRIDIFSDEGQAKVKNLLKGAPVFLFCDNGNKPKEFNTFVPYLESGSVVSVHDWTGEIGPDDVSKLVEERRLVPWEEHLWLSVSTATWFVP
jgi:hypothetical protein